MKAYLLRFLSLGIAFVQPSSSVHLSVDESKEKHSAVDAIIESATESATINASDTEDQQPRSQELRRCSVEQLLPSWGSGGILESGWKPLARDETRASEYNCTCVFTKAR